MPALLLFLLLRMLAGSDGRGGVEFDDPWLAQSLRVNNPMAIFLTIRFTRLIMELEAQIIDPVPVFFRQMAIGAAGGYGMGWGIGVGVNAVRPEYDGPCVEP